MIINPRDVALVIEYGTSADTVKAAIKMLTLMVECYEENGQGWSLTEYAEGMKLRLHPERPSEEGPMIVGSSYSGFSSGFSEEFMLGEMPDGTPTLISSEGWG